MSEGNASDSRRESLPLTTALGNPIESAPQAFELKQMALQKSFEVMCANTVRDASASPILLLLSPQTLPDGSAAPDSNVLVEQYFWDGQNPRLKEKEPSRFANSSFPSPKQHQLHIFSIASNASLMKALTSLKEIGMPRGHWYLIDFADAAFNRDPVEVPAQDGQAMPAPVENEETVIQRERLRRETSRLSRASSARSRGGSAAASRRSHTAAAGPAGVEIPLPMPRGAFWNCSCEGSVRPSSSNGMAVWVVPLGSLYDAPAPSSGPTIYRRLLRGHATLWISLTVWSCYRAVSYTHLRAHETVLDLVCRLLLEKKKNKIYDRYHETK
eukprot:TRINITY_DN22455_c0_g1_i2.p1 TRINITY_DN22455_c0_g1~~TRINITY_DN22455_c0_g1_i2.p1  ORF type:complete len:328 (-),score=-1.75 TRINITY_DN22455_c0_g1_i2:19-1002(-)